VALDGGSSLNYRPSVLTEPLHTIIETPDVRFASPQTHGRSGDRGTGHAIAANPAVGDLIQGTGGARKLRWARKGQGKSGGFRVITFYHSEGIPVFLLDIYGKNEKSNLSDAEKNALSKILTRIIGVYQKGVREHVQGR
jgi:hypothetical protein